MARGRATGAGRSPARTSRASAIQGAAGWSSSLASQSGRQSVVQDDSSEAASVNHCLALWSSPRSRACSPAVWPSGCVRPDAKSATCRLTATWSAYCPRLGVVGASDSAEPRSHWSRSTARVSSQRATSRRLWGSVNSPRARQIAQRSKGGSAANCEEIAAIASAVSSHSMASVSTAAERSAMGRTQLWEPETSAGRRRIEVNRAEKPGTARGSLSGKRLRPRPAL